jgi:hypothetical protein
MSYGIIFWGSSSNSNNIFKLQKRIKRMNTNSRNRDSCKDPFKKLNILSFYSQYILSLIIFVNDNILLLVGWVPCHDGMARPRVACGGTASSYGG